MCRRAVEIENLALPIRAGRTGPAPGRSAWKQQAWKRRIQTRTYGGVGARRARLPSTRLRECPGPKLWVGCLLLVSGSLVTWMRRSGQRCEGRKPYDETAEEGMVVEKMKTWRKEGKSFKEIAEALNTEGVPPRSGVESKWHPTQVQQVLNRVKG